MSIHGLYYFNAAGELGYFDTPDDPYFQGEAKSKLGLALFGDNSGVGWDYFKGQDDHGSVRLSFENGCRAIHDATRTRIITLGQRPPSILWPNNAAVFNEDGTLNHVIARPEFVEHSFPGNPRTDYPAEGFVHLQYYNAKVVLGVSFEFQWVQLRAYNPFTREWGEVFGVYRQ